MRDHGKVAIGVVCPVFIAGLVVYAFHEKTVSDINIESARRAEQYSARAAATREIPQPSYNPALDTKLRELRERYTEASLPDLYKELENPDQWELWGWAVHMIALVGGNDDSAAAVIKFIESDYVPPNLDDRYVGTFYAAKFNGLRPLGAIGGPVATEFLMQVWKGEKAKELTEQWYNRPRKLMPFDEPELMEQLLRNRAAVGLAVTQDPAIREQIFNAYVTAKNNLQTRLLEELDDSAKRAVFTWDDRAEEKNVSGLAEALAFYDMVAERGIDSFWRTINAGHNGRPELGHYMERYRFPYWEYQQQPGSMSKW